MSSIKTGRPLWIMVSLAAICLLISAPILYVHVSGPGGGEQGNGTVTVTDMVGDAVDVPKNPQRVAALARSSVDMLVAFGLGDKITGIYYTIFDNEWAGILYPGISNYQKYDYNTTVETYLEQKVELVFAPERYIAENLREHGIPAMTVSQYGTPNYDGYVFYFADMIKQIWDDETAAERIDIWKGEFAQIRDQITTALAGVESGKTLYYVRGDRNRGIVATENNGMSIQSTICGYLKLEYAGKHFNSANPTAEAILKLDPDFVIVGGAYQNEIISDAKASAIWKNLSAFKNNNIFNIGIGFVMFEQNGVELTIYLAELANKIYPEIFSFDTEELLKDTMRTYFGTELTDTDAYNMLRGLNRNGQPLV
jgi:iron complex transport system substrate-binding protein